MSGNNKKQKGFLHENHRKPVTRRDLLAQGFISSSAFMMMPSALSLITGRAYGAEGELVCKAESGSGSTVPFLIFDLAGGANIAGTNVIVGDKGGQKAFLQKGSYASIGLGADQEPGVTGVTIDETYGLAFHPLSKMLQGIKQFAPTLGPNIDGALFLTTSNDDSKNNPHSPLYWIANAGLSSSLVPLVGSANSAAGGNSTAPAESINPAKQPSVIAQPGDASGLVSPGKLATLLGTATAPDSASVTKVMKAIRSMSESRLRQFQQLDLPTQVQTLIRCGYLYGEQSLSSDLATKIDPTKDTQVTGLYTLTDKTQGAAGTIAKLVLEGYAGAGVVSLGGFDYHGRGRAAQDAQDLLAGQMIGRALALAALKQKPLMIYVYTDGGVSANGGGNGILAFSSDSGERSAAFTLVYNPAGKPGMRESTAGKGRQIGAYKAGGSVDTTAGVTSANVTALSKAITANWLALHGREGDIAKAVGDNPFGTQYENYLAFKKITG